MVRPKSTLFYLWMTALSAFLWVQSYFYYSLIEVLGKVAFGCGSYRGATSLFIGSRGDFDFWWYFTDRESNALCSEGFLQIGFDRYGLTPILSSYEGLLVLQIPYWFFVFFWSFLLMHRGASRLRFSLKELFLLSTALVVPLAMFSFESTILLDILLHIATICVVLNATGLWLERSILKRKTNASSQEE